MELDTQNQKPETHPGYLIGGVCYQMPEGLSWQQNKWLGDHIFKDVDLNRLDYGTIHDLLRDKGPLLMAICLVEDGKTRAKHSRLSWQTISQRADMFAAELSGGEVAAFGPHFFQSCQPASMVMLMPGRQMQAEFEALAKRLAAAGSNGSSIVSSLSATETSPSSAPSLLSGAQPSLIPISSAASSDRPSTEPSLAGAASNCPG